MILDSFFDFKAYVMLPFFILIIALIIRMRPGEAFLSALKMGVGFAGIFIAFDFFVANIQPAVEAFASVRGLAFPVLDVGWPPLAAITWGSTLAPISIPLIILLNVIMLALNWTRTIYIDIWNYWHFALIGALILNVTANFWLGLLAVGLIAVYTIKCGDWSAPYVAKEEGIHGLTISPVSVAGLIPFSASMDALYDRIPGLRKIEYNPQKAGASIGILAEPMIIGLIIGALLGLAAGYDLKNLLELAIHIAAVMFILPKTAGLIAEGIKPVTETLRERIQARFPNKEELYVAVDTGILMENKSVIISGLLLMPIALGLAFVIPGNRTLPLGDLPNLLSIISLTVLASRGNVFRAVLTGIPLVATFMLIASRLAPLYTRLSAEVGLDFASGQEITAFTDGGNHVRYWLFHLFQGNIVALILIPVVAGMIYIAWRRAERIRKELSQAS